MHNDDREEQRCQSREEEDHIDIFVLENDDYCDGQDKKLERQDKKERLFFHGGLDKATFKNLSEESEVQEHNGTCNGETEYVFEVFHNDEGKYRAEDENEHVDAFYVTYCRFFYHLFQLVL